MTDVDGVRLGTEAARLLRQTGRFEIGPGLTDAEFDRIERTYGFEFADDHRAFLAAGTPVTPPHARSRAGHDPWPDWRNGSPEELREQLDRPVSGVLFDVEHNGVWPDNWGAQPTQVAERLASARRQLAEVPQLVPVYAHRCLPAGRGTYGHPVLSIYQTDIIFYGVDLIDYIHQEFGGPGMDRSDPNWNPQATVPFWRDFL